MKRVVFYFLIILAFCSRLICHHFYMLLIKAAHKSQGVKFEGFPEYIHTDAYLDPSGGLYIESGAVISTRTIVLTHDWSFLKRRQTGKYRAYHSVRIGNNTFVGVGAIILPGTIIGKFCIIGAGAVVKGKIDDYSIMVGNPAKRIGDTRS